MSFTTLVFLFLFLPVALILYRYMPKGKNLVLVLLSFLFYAWDNPAYLLLLILSVCWNDLSAKWMNQQEGKKRRNTLIGSIIVDLMILGFFKYTNFLIDILNVFPFHLQHLPIHLPIGLSFFTFSAISYLVDVYKKKTPIQYNWLSLALYIGFFGKVNMGPIVQYADMADQLENHPQTKELFYQGIMLFLKGMFKKVLIADRLAILFGAMASDTTLLGTWLYAISYTLQLYFDFSGYSDMAIGLGRMFGFTFSPNFDHPYIATSAQDFWRRWHISLSRWFRDYLYIPLGGNRAHYIRNIFIVWFATGLWHGANWTFIFWGLYYGCFLLLEKYWLKERLQKLPNWVSHVYALVVIIVGWVFFFSPDILTAFHTVGRMFGLGIGGICSTQTLFYVKTYLVVLVAAILFSMPISQYAWRADFVLFKKHAQTVATAVYVFFFFVSISFIVSSTYQSFLYFAF